MPDYGSLFDEAVLSADGRQYFAGQSDDPFFLDLRVFDLLYGTDLSLTGNDTLDGYNVQDAGAAGARPTSWRSAATRAPTPSSASGPRRAARRRARWPPTAAARSAPRATTCRCRASAPRWSTRSSSRSARRTCSTRARSRWTTSSFLPQRAGPGSSRGCSNLLYGNRRSPDTDDDTDGTQRSDLVSVFLTGVEDLTDPTINEGVDEVVPSEVLRLNMSVAPTAEPERLGVLAGDLQGYPNGRRLTDDVTDISLQAVAGELLDEGASVRAPSATASTTNDVAFQRHLPVRGPALTTTRRTGAEAADEHLHPAPPGPSRHRRARRPGDRLGAALSPCRPCWPPAPHRAPATARPRTPRATPAPTGPTCTRSSAPTTRTASP